MIPTPAHYLSAPNTAHAPRWRAEVVRGAQTTTLALLGGTLTKAWDRSPRERLTIGIPAAGPPALLDQRLLPTGAQLRLYWSVWPWTQELLLHEGELIRSGLARPGGVWQLESADRSAVIAADLLDQLSYTPPTGQSVGAFITWIVHRTYPSCPISIAAAANTVPVPNDLRVTGDPWSAVVAAAAAAGCEAVMLPGPQCIVRPVPVIGTVVDRLDAATNITVYDLDHQRGYSGVLMIYDARDGNTTNVVGRWSDTRPDSPTAVARIGRVPYRETQQGSPTQVQADAAAAALAGYATGNARAATIRHIARPWLEPGDTIEVRYAGGPLEAALVDTVEIPIGAPNVQTTIPRNAAYKLKEAA